MGRFIIGFSIGITLSMIICLLYRIYKELK